MNKLYDPRFHPSEGLDRCADILVFLREAVEFTQCENCNFSEEGVTGLASILGLLEAAVREVGEVIGVVDMHSFLKARQSVKEAGAAKTPHGQDTAAMSATA